MNKVYYKSTKIKYLYIINSVVSYTQNTMPKACMHSYTTMYKFCSALYTRTLETKSALLTDDGK